jgi:signal peptidase I
LIGWSSYLIETGSMKPSIQPGDVVITSPNPELDQLGGRVITFNSPSIPGQVITHRVVEISDDGQMRTKGDANATADSATITIADVRGMGRLLVQYVGLPKVWLQTGAWLPLAAFLLSVIIAGAAIRWDREGDPDPVDDASGEPPTGPAGIDVQPGPAWGAPVGGVVALRALLRAPVPADASAAAPRRRRLPLPLPGSATVFVLLAALYASALAIPSAVAAMAASTQSPASSWSVPQYSYTSTLQGYTPWVYYKLDETSGGNATDASGNGRTGSYSGTITFGQDGAFDTDTPDRAVALGSATSCITMANSAKLTPAPTVYSSTGWFKVPAGYDQGGKLLGFESSRNGVSSSASGGQYDRHVYLDGSGRIRFGVWLGSSFTLKSQAGLNDGNWHFVATTMGPAGMSLYIDGELVASSTNTASEVFSNGGWWRFGCGNLAGWDSTTGANEAWSGPNAPTAQQNYPLRGTLDELAIWQGRVLTADEIAFLYFAR